MCEGFCLYLTGAPWRWGWSCDFPRVAFRGDTPVRQTWQLLLGWGCVPWSTFPARGGWGRGGSGGAHPRPQTPEGRAQRTELFPWVLSLSPSPSPIGQCLLFGVHPQDPKSTPLGVPGRGPMAKPPSLLCFLLPQLRPSVLARAPGCHPTLPR